MTINLTTFVAVIAFAFTLGLVLHPAAKTTARKLNSIRKARRFNRAVRIVEAEGYSVNLVLLVDNTETTQDLHWLNRPASPADWSDADAISYQQV